MTTAAISIDQENARDENRVTAVIERHIARRARARMANMLAEAGIQVDGAMPWDPKVHDDRVFVRVLRDGTLGAGEAYVDGDWDCAALDELATRIAASRFDRQAGSIWRTLVTSAAARSSNRQRKRVAIANGRAHYDLGDDLFAAMLGSTMAYSCGYWRTANNLDDAQRAKIELACAKLDLRHGQTLLDVGCGYGELARHAAAEHHVRVVGVTVSRNQAEHARRRCAGLPVEIRELDYRDIHGRFDRIVSIGMFEHVGVRNYKPFFERMHRLLAPGGLLLLHTIGNRFETESFEPWLDRYIFPGAMLPSAAQIAKAIDGRFVIEDWHNFGADYDRTLLAWHANFARAWPSLQYYGEPFRRRWCYYLLTCAGSFRARRNQLWQIVLSPEGHRGGYRRPLV